MSDETLSGWPRGPRRRGILPKGGCIAMIPRDRDPLQQRERERERGRVTLHSQSSLRTLYARSDPYKCNHDGEAAADEASMRRGVACARETTALDWSCAFFKRPRGARSNRVLMSTRPGHPRSDDAPAARLSVHRPTNVDVCARAMWSRCVHAIRADSTRRLPGTRGWDF